MFDNCWRSFHRRNILLMFSCFWMIYTLLVFYCLPNVLEDQHKKFLNSLAVDNLRNPKVELYFKHHPLGIDFQNQVEAHETTDRNDTNKVIKAKNEKNGILHEESDVKNGEREDSDQLKFEKEKHVKKEKLKYIDDDEIKYFDADADFENRMNKNEDDGRYVNDEIVSKFGGVDNHRKPISNNNKVQIDESDSDDAGRLKGSQTPSQQQPIISQPSKDRGQQESGQIHKQEQGRGEPQPRDQQQVIHNQGQGQQPSQGQGQLLQHAQDQRVQGQQPQLNLQLRQSFDQQLQQNGPGQQLQGQGQQLQGQGEQQAVVGQQKQVDPPGIKTEDSVVFPKFVEKGHPNGPGEGGLGVLWQKSQLKAEEVKEWDQGFKFNSFNQYISDRVSVHRTVLDQRTPECIAKQYPESLPSCSVVIIFHNEAWSVLLRSVYSVLEQTPPSLLDAIFLVDDKSTMGHLGKPLDKYFEQNPKVRILRMPERGGLTQARLLGFKSAKSSVVVFLDSHIECTTGWYEPLASPIKENKRTVTFPTIDTIDANNLAYRAAGFGSIGGLELTDLTFRWFSRKDSQDKTAPVPSPTMPGGLFAISRERFEELGTYDPELKFWGGENIELSFKAWMCKGSIVVVPCSHVGHIFRRTNPIKWTSGGSVTTRNSQRVAAVWMDQYSMFFLETLGTSQREADIGDIEPRKAMRERLKCHDFRWYLDNVFPELKRQMDNTAPYSGEIRNMAAPVCVDSSGKDVRAPIIYPCHEQGFNQFWLLTAEGQLKQKNMYLVYNEGRMRIMYHPIISPEWNYREDGTLLNLPKGQCLQASTNRRTLILAPCKPSSPWQRWKLHPRLRQILQSLL